jgi:hypothetical protein
MGYYRLFFPFFSFFLFFTDIIERLLKQPNISPQLNHKDGQLLSFKRFFPNNGRAGLSNTKQNIFKHLLALHKPNLNAISTQICVALTVSCSKEGSDSIGFVTGRPYSIHTVIPMPPNSTNEPSRPHCTLSLIEFP